MQPASMHWAARRFKRTAGFSLALALALTGGAHAATVSCGVGDRVEGEFGGGEIGTIAEIGTEAPHVGSYRITFGWSPKGEWYHPNTWDVHPQGSADRCQPPGAAAAGSTPAVAASNDDDSPPAVAAALPAGIEPSDDCRPGTRVTDRQQRAGEVRGELNGMCVVALDDGGSRSYLAWMLSPATQGADASAGKLSAGRYVCSTAGAGHFDIHIVDGSTYADRAGKRGSYTLVGDRIEFQSGSLADYHSRLLGDGKFGLASEPVQTFYVVCNLN